MMRPLIPFFALLFVAFNASADTPVNYDSPPRVGDVLQPQLRLIHCQQPRAARFSSNTGFIGEGCQPLDESDTWTVVRCTHKKLAEGGMWLVEIQNSLGDHRFVPIPWHDWV